jgi:hypothetical protein
MGHKDGIVAMGSYDGTLTAAIEELRVLIEDPDLVLSTYGVAREPGSNLDEMSPIARAQLQVELDAFEAGQGAGGEGIAYGQHTVTAGEATANQADIVTGLADTSVANIAVSVSRAGSLVTADAVITEPSAGTIRVADGAVTYDMTAGDIITWFAIDPA